MTFKNYHKLLGKEINLFDKTFLERFEKHYIDGDLYFISRNPNLDLYGLLVNEIRIFSDNERINSIRLYFDSLVNKNFYENLVNDYGFPDKINVVNKIEIISSNIDENSSNKKVLEKKYLSITDGLFEDKPLSIIWKKDEFDLTLLFKNEEKTTQIILELP